MTSRRGHTDAALAIGVAAAALVVYVATLAPGLIAITDTPKFQFVGRILGTAHPPGYPLYVMVSHVFGYLPIGSLAYRINLMSAVFTAAACALMFWCAGTLGAGRLAAAVAVLAFAFGPAVWYVSTIAEVYALNAFLVAATLAAVLAWQRSQRAGWFFAAVALVGLALGNHTTSVFLIPAVAIFACVVAPRFALRPRTIACAAFIVSLGVAQYLFVLLRTHQGAWGEAPASNLTELARVMSGSEYFADLMPGGIGAFLGAGVPRILWTFVEEMSIPGVALAGLGIAALSIRSRAVLALLGAGLIPYIAFAAAYTPRNFEVFLVPAFIMSWLLAAAGAHSIVEALHARAGWPGAVLLAGALGLVPVSQLVRNYEARDLSHSRADMRFFDALFDRLPEESALLHEDFLVDRMVYYKTLGERAAERRRILALVPNQLEHVERVWRDRHSIFAFPETARQMRLLDGAEFSYEPLDLSNGTLARYLEDLPRGTIVAVGVPARHLGSFAPAGRLPLDAIGFTRDLGGVRQSVAVVGARGAGAADVATDRLNAHLRFDQPATGGGIDVRVEPETAVIAYGGRDILRTETGIAVATWRGGRLTAAFAVPASTTAPPALPTGYNLFPLLAIRERHGIGATPTDLTSTADTGNIIYTTGAGASRFVLYAARRRPLAPSLLECSAPRWPSLDVRGFDGPHAADGELSRALGQDGLPPEGRLLAMPHVYRIAIDADWPSAMGVRIGLGGVPDVAFGRITTGATGLIYQADLSTHLARVDDRTVSLHMAGDHHAHLVGAGWSPLQADGIGPYRETTGPEAELLLPIAAPGPLRIGVQLLALPSSATFSGPRAVSGSAALSGPRAETSVDLQINGHQLSAVTAERAWRRYWWEVPSAAVKGGINEIVLRVSPDGGRVAVSDLLVETRQ